MTKMTKKLRTKLVKNGLTEEEATKLEGEGLKESDLTKATTAEIREVTGCGLFVAKRVIEAFAPVVSEKKAETKEEKESDPNTEIPEGTSPSESQVNNFANQMGIDPSMFTMFMFSSMGSNAGMDIDIGSMIPVDQVASSYSPKIRNMTYMVMSQIENRLGTPIVVINDDGSVNPDLTAAYVISLEEGFDRAEDNIYYDEGNLSYEIIKVGVDAQSVYDSDPLNSSKALQKNGMGIGRVNWKNIPLEVKQIVFYAVKNGELNNSDKSQLTWLRANIKKDATKSSLRSEFPKATMDYNEAYRIGALPTLRTQLSRAPRKKETMARRRPYNGNGGSAASGNTFPGESSDG